MKTTKKILSIVLALAMLVNVFVISTVALSPDTAVDLYISADKEVYSPGDEIVLKVSAQVVEAIGQMTLTGMYSLGYNGDYIRPYSETGKELADHGFANIAPGFDAGASTVSFWSNETTLGVVVYEDDTNNYGWTEAINYQLAGTDAFDASSAITELFTVKMKIAENAPDGDYTIGFNPGSYDNYSGSITDEEFNELLAPDYIPEEAGYDAAALFSYGKVTFKVSSAPVVTGPSVAKAQAQVKFLLNETGDGVQDAFKLRIKSKISDADWDAYFGSTTDDTATTNKITAVGMVAFPVGDFDEAAAMTAIENIKNPDYTGAYKAASTTYIQKVDDASDAYFGAIIELSHEETKNANLKYIGFVQYKDNTGADKTIFYATAYEANISDPNYGNLVAKVLPSQA